MTTQEIIKEYKELSNLIERGYDILSKYRKGSKNYINLEESIKIVRKKLIKIDNWLDAVEEGNGYELKL